MACKRSASMEESNVEEPNTSGGLPFSYDQLMEEPSSFLEMLGENPVSPSPSCKSATSEPPMPKFKKARANPETEIVSVQKQILQQLTCLQVTHNKILKQLEKRNELEEKKMELAKNEVTGSQPFTINSEDTST